VLSQKSTSSDDYRWRGAQSRTRRIWLTSGLAKFSASDYNLHRFDAEMSEKLSDGLYYMVGGYESASPGTRDAQFLSEKGSRFTVNLTRKFDNGKIDLWTRVTDDVGQRSPCAMFCTGAWLFSDQKSLADQWAG
jgi:hypothetical protein